MTYTNYNRFFQLPAVVGTHLFTRIFILRENLVVEYNLRQDREADHRPTS